jgi:hypothetical protein
VFKIFRKKIQSLSQTQQNIITVILILFNLTIIIFWINFWLGLKKAPPKTEETSPSQEAPTQEFLQKQFTPPSETTEPSEEFMKKLFKPGK